MNKFINKAKIALEGEDGSPNIETIIGISVALVVATAFIALGTMMVGWLGGAQNTINAFKQS